VTPGQRLCHLEDLPDGAARGFAPSDRTAAIFLVRRGDRIFAYRDQCPHQGTPLAWRRDEYLSPDRERIVCSGHGAEFEITSGLCLRGPCVGQYLVRVAVCVNRDGNVILRHGDSANEQPAVIRPPPSSGN
jgi:nitrite reductase/ring-hydroxylating ferredoxin subunit